MAMQKIAKAITAVLMFSFFALFFFFVIRSWSADPFEDDGVPMELLFIAFVVLIILMAAVNFIASVKGRAKTPETTVRMKKCATCGTAMEATAHVCPGCRTIQPASFSDNENDIKKK